MKVKHMYYHSKKTLGLILLHYEMTYPENKPQNNRNTSSYSISRNDRCW